MGSTERAIPETQSAVVVKTPGPDWKIEIDHAYPVPQLSPGQALVRLTHTGVCHSDLSAFNGGWSWHMGCDVPGHEGVGRIVAYHADVDASQVPPLDTKVGVPMIRKPCAACHVCALPDGEVMCPNTQFHGMHVNGTYQQYMALETSYLVPLGAAAAELDDAVIAPVLCGGVTAYKALKKADAKPGTTCVVAGSGGGLGSFAVQYARAMGLRVIGIDAGTEKKESALRLGAADFVDFRECGDVPARIKELTEGRGADAVIVIAPTETTYNEALMYAGFCSTVVCVGLPHEDVRMKVPPALVMHRDIAIKGAMVGTRQDIAEALDFAVQGKVLSSVVVYPMEQISDIFKKMEKHEVIGRAVLRLDVERPAS